MVYQQIENDSLNAIRPLMQELETSNERIRELTMLIEIEDSKKKEQEWREERKTLTKRRFIIFREMDNVKLNVFKKLLVEEYGLAFNKKFDMAFDIAWDCGHSNGYSEVEGFFSRLVDLIR